MSDNNIGRREWEMTDPEIAMLQQVHAMLVCAPKDARRRIIKWLLDRLEEDWLKRDQAADDCRAMATRLRGKTREPPPPPDERLRAAAVLVVETFEPDEAQGYRSKDRQFAVSVLRRALEGKE